MNCNQCAKRLGFLEGDFEGLGDGELMEGYRYAVLCEGCGPCYVDDKGNCIFEDCDFKHEKCKGDRNHE